MSLCRPSSNKHLSLLICAKSPAATLLQDSWRADRRPMMDRKEKTGSAE